MEHDTKENRTSKNEGYVDRVAALNVSAVMNYIQANSPALNALIEAGAVGIVGGMYDVKTGKVEFHQNDSASSDLPHLTGVHTSISGV
jgi:carbonic anhydrase